jgi:hypothetical protein
MVMSTTMRRKPVQSTISESQRVLFMPIETTGSSKLIVMFEVGAAG